MNLRLGEQSFDVVRKTFSVAPNRCDLLPPRPLNNGTLNKTLKVLAQVLDDAVEFGYVDSNTARRSDGG